LTADTDLAQQKDFILPPRSAEPPSEGEPAQTQGSGGVTHWVLHSPLSPLSPGSTLYPDGILDDSWLKKHQVHVPSIFLSCFPLASDPGRDSLNDNRLKNEINSIKSALQTSTYKSRLAVLLVGDGTILQTSDIEERITNIKRATGLDPKHSLFFMPFEASRSDVAALIRTMLDTLQPQAVEHYRDLTKHARRKKGRGTIPPPTVPPTRGTSQTLSSQAWSVRYDFKMGVFAEFRQEMDAAGRHYGFALDTLLGSDGIFETMANWSPRWDETRLLADAIALRSLRCMLWNNQPTSAVQAWWLYRERIHSVLDRKGKGSSNYGWEAWESRWAKAMAEIVQRADLPIFSIRSREELEANPTFAPPEKSFPIGERLPPWSHLHHPGYWLGLSAKHATQRRKFAEEIPDEDRAPPAEVPASQVAQRYRTYDTYLVPEPHLEYPLSRSDGVDHCAEIIELLNRGVSQFFPRGQQRYTDYLNWRIAKELIHSKRYTEAVGVLQPVWESMSWRIDGWTNVAAEIIWTLNEAAHSAEDAENIVMTEWELLSQSKQVVSRKTQSLT
jgi:trafficking protein particle complex subunit 11